MGLQKYSCYVLMEATHQDRNGCRFHAVGLASAPMASFICGKGGLGARMFGRTTTRKQTGSIYGPVGRGAAYWPHSPSPPLCLMSGRYMQGPRCRFRQTGQLGAGGGGGGGEERPTDRKAEGEESETV